MNETCFGDGGEPTPVIFGHQTGRWIAPRPALSSATFDSGQSAVNYALHVPDNYSPGYAYPLIVWFHDDGQNEQDVARCVPRISPQNYLGVGLRAPLPLRSGSPAAFRWSGGTEHRSWLEEDVAAVLDDVLPASVGPSGTNRHRRNRHRRNDGTADAASPAGVVCRYGGTERHVAGRLATRLVGTVHRTPGLAGAEHPVEDSGRRARRPFSPNASCRRTRRHPPH